MNFAPYSGLFAMLDQSVASPSHTRHRDCDYPDDVGQVCIYQDRSIIRLYSTPMTRPLDFIVFGVARSGTKTLARALNLHPHVYCAQERFYFRVDHSQITFPNSFLDSSDISNSYDLDKIERVRTALAEKSDIRHIGNKLPSYYFRLEQINRDIPALKNIWIYRSPYGFMQSWNRREASRLGTRKGRWRAGQVGLFGLLELLCCIDNCVRLKKDVFIFPYDHGLNRSSEPITQALHFLGARPVYTTLRPLKRGI